MHCLDASELMSLRLDSALADGQEEALREHLSGCQACAAQWEALQRVSCLFEHADYAAPSPVFLRKVMARIQRRAAWLSVLRHGLIFFLGLVILSAVCLGPLLALRSLLLSVLGDTSMVNAIVGVAVRMVDILNTLARAMGLVLKALFSGNGCVVLLGYLLVAGLLAACWLRLVARPAGQMSQERA
jgi:anti-sigma factor RsiW